MSESRTEFTTVPEGIGGLSESDYHELFAAERRRTTLAILADRTDPIDLENLAAAVATREHDAGLPDDEAVDRVAASLYHVHLPKMDGAGLVDYDPDANRIELRLRRTDSLDGSSTAVSQ